jgi:hypothetical protein
MAPALRLLCEGTAKSDWSVDEVCLHFRPSSQPPPNGGRSQPSQG